MLASLRSPAKTTTNFMGHKRAVIRSKSHMPESFYLAPPHGMEPQNLDALSEHDQHQMLRRFHSFPYHVFDNVDTEYSSDESNRSSSKRQLQQQRRRQQQRERFAMVVEPPTTITTATRRKNNGDHVNGGLYLKPSIIMSDGSTTAASSSPDSNGKKR